MAGAQADPRRAPAAAQGTPKSTSYAPGTAAFSRLADRLLATGVHKVSDRDHDPEKQGIELAHEWVRKCGAIPRGIQLESVERRFEGTALVRVRATVAHDSYERLVEVKCQPIERNGSTGRKDLAALPEVIEDPRTLAIDADAVSEAAARDSGIGEFCRFYLERRAQEVAVASGDTRKRKKLEDDFTPRLGMTLVGLEGEVHRDLKFRVQYGWEDGADYGSLLTVSPGSGEVVGGPHEGRAAIAAVSCLKTALSVAR